MIYLVGGMMIFWLATFAYVWSIARRQKQLDEEIAALSDVVEKPARR
ncbi:MAG: CcmD family protein [Caldilineales bacterium]